MLAVFIVLGGIFYFGCNDPTCFCNPHGTASSSRAQAAPGDARAIIAVVGGSRTRQRTPAQIEALEAKRKAKDEAREKAFRDRDAANAAIQGAIVAAADGVVVSRNPLLDADSSDSDGNESED
eukprot:COSAG02_NODE_1144_length_14244_cov_16.832096_14_plen_123_part_00